MVEEEEFVQDGLGHVVGQILEGFYTCDGPLGSRDLEWLQGALNVLIGLFLKIGLSSNVDKSNTMTCQPEVIRSSMLE